MMISWIIALMWIVKNDWLINGDVAFSGVHNFETRYMALTFHDNLASSVLSPESQLHTASRRIRLQLFQFLPQTRLQPIFP